MQNTLCKGTPLSVASSSVSIFDRHSKYSTPSTSPPPARPQNITFDKSPSEQIADRKNKNSVRVEEVGLLSGHDDRTQGKTFRNSANRRLFVPAKQSSLTPKIPSHVVDDLLSEPLLAVPNATSPRIFLKHFFDPYTAKTFSKRTLHNILVREISKDLNTSDNAGAIYAYTDVCSPGYVKVGCNSKFIEDRIAAQRRRCNFRATTESDLLRRETPCHQKLEKLVHTELAGCRWRMLSCRGCGVAHREWSKNDVPEVFEVVERWRKWLALDVYVGRRLDGIWVDKLHLLVYIEGESWKDTWEKWVWMVVLEKHSREQEQNPAVGALENEVKKDLVLQKKSLGSEFPPNKEARYANEGTAVKERRATITAVHKRESSGKLKSLEKMEGEIENLPEAVRNGNEKNKQQSKHSSQEFPSAETIRKHTDTPIKPTPESNTEGTTVNNDRHEQDTVLNKKISNRSPSPQKTFPDNPEKPSSSPLSNPLFEIHRKEAGLDDDTSEEDAAAQSRRSSVWSTSQEQPEDPLVEALTRGIRVLAL